MSLPDSQRERAILMYDVIAYCRAMLHDCQVARRALSSDDGDGHDLADEAELRSRLERLQQLEPLLQAEYDGAVADRAAFLSEHEA